MGSGVTAQISVGQRVKIINPQSVFHLKHRKGPVFGEVVSRNGAYILVRPYHTRFEVEFYPNEIRVVPPARISDKLIARLAADLALQVTALERVPRGRYGKAAGTFAWIAKLADGTEIGSEDTMQACVDAKSLSVFRSAVSTLTPAVCANN